MRGNDLGLKRIVTHSTLPTSSAGVFPASRGPGSRRLHGTRPPCPPGPAWLVALKTRSLMAQVCPQGHRAAAASLRKHVTLFPAGRKGRGRAQVFLSLGCTDEAFPSSLQPPCASACVRTVTASRPCEGDVALPASSRGSGAVGHHRLLGSAEGGSHRFWKMPPGILENMGLG